MELKLSNGCNIQNSACLKSGAMIMMKLEKNDAEEIFYTQEGSNWLLHGTVA
jgi:hypothetical protein